MTNKSENQFATKGDLNKLETKIGKNIRGFKDEMKTFMGVLYEKFDNEVKVVAEQYIDTNRNLVNINKHLGHVDQRLDKLEIKTEVLMETVAELKEDMTVMKEDMTVMKEDMTVMKEDMTVMKEDMTVLKTDMKEVKEELLPGATRKINKLEHRVTVLESRA
ncbi:MAG: hypothetical protein HYX20_03830 [Candidatus Yanofskybacteria bacterium]|nr:hypothetical protein [Candidatus Yanofskybacteria bacterium]